MGYIKLAIKGPAIKGPAVGIEQYWLNGNFIVLQGPFPKLSKSLMHTIHDGMLVCEYMLRLA